MLVALVLVVAATLLAGCDDKPCRHPGPTIYVTVHVSKYSSMSVPVPSCDD